MPLPGRPGRLSKLRVESIRFDDTDEVITAIEKLGCAEFQCCYKSYETLRNILLKRGVIELVSDSTAVLVGSRPQTLSRLRAVAPVAPVSHVAPVDPVATVAPVVFGPDTLETTLKRREIKQTIKTEREYARRLEEECQPYIMEANYIKQRIGDVSEQIRDLSWLLSNLNEKIDKYMLVKLQKQEELMHLRDRLMHLRERLEEIRSIVRSIYMRYETPIPSWLCKSPGPMKMESYDDRGGKSGGTNRKSKTKRKSKTRRKICKKRC
jgi:hypothetical protein